MQATLPLELHPPPQRVDKCYSVLYSVLCAACLVAAIVPFATSVGPVPPLWLLWLWPAVVYAVVVFAYTTSDRSLGERLFGKRANGTLRLQHALPMAPALVFSHAVWLFRHTFITPFREAPFNWVAPGVAVGRFPLFYPSQFPVEAANVIDLTCEFSARACVTRNRKYLCLPCLDTTLPAASALLDAARDAAAWQGSTYVHCANGHGRSAAMAALIMVVRGQAATWRDAFAAMRQRGRLVRLRAPQAAVLDALAAQLDVLRANYAAATATRPQAAPLGAVSPPPVVVVRPAGTAAATPSMVAGVANPTGADTAVV